MRALFKLVVLVVAVVLVVGLFVPPNRTNPAVNPAATFEAVAKPGPELAAVVQRACYDCHSDTTVWPWYSRVAPVSWLLAKDVNQGRAHLNFSRWANYSSDLAREKLQNACEQVKAGEMPLWQYRIIHPQARLSEADVKTICGGLVKAPDRDPSK